MAWTATEWACGHTGHMQLYGKSSARESRVAWEAGRNCMACWLVEQWEKDKDPRALKEDRYLLAAAIAENKGKRIDIFDWYVHPVTEKTPVKINPLENISTADLMAEIKRRESDPDRPAFLGGHERKVK